MHPLYLSIQGPCPSTSNSPTEIAFSAADPLVVIAGARVDEDFIRRAIAYALYGQSACAEQQLPDTDSLCLRVTFVFCAHGHAWEVHRAAAHLAGGAASDTACSLRRMGDADPTAAVLHGARRVNRRLGELLELDSQNLIPPRRHPAARCRSPEPVVGEGDARDDLPLPARSKYCANAWRRSGAKPRHCGKRLLPQFQVSGQTGRFEKPSCTGRNGIAIPPRRSVRLGARGRMFRPDHRDGHWFL